VKGKEPAVKDLRYSGAQHEAEAVYKEIVTSSPRKLDDLMHALLTSLGRNDMMAYLVMMEIRQVEGVPLANQRCLAVATHSLTSFGILSMTSLPKSTSSI